MDPAKFKEVYERLQYLDENLGYKVREIERSASHMPTTSSLGKQLSELARFTNELKDIVRDLMISIASKPRK